MINTLNYRDKKALGMACDVLKAGGIIVYPTDTLYGFGCDAKNDESIKKINALKNRVAPMSVMVNSKNIVKTWLNVNSSLKNDIADMLHNGNTIIVPIKADIVSDLICGPNNSLGIRIPKHPFCKQLNNLYPNPITTTSVNRTQNPPMTDPLKISEEFSNNVNLIIEDGIIKGKGSSINLYDQNNNTWKKIR